MIGDPVDFHQYKARLEGRQPKNEPMNPNASALASKAILLALAWCFGTTQGQAFNRPNIVIFVVDDLGYGDLGCTGHPRIRTPNIDAIARDGLTFTNYYSPASVCSPSRAAMLTGRMPHRSGIYGFIHAGAPGVHLPRTETTFPSVLRDAGYRTSLVGKWHVSLVEHAKSLKVPTPRDHGFDDWFCSDNNTVIRNKPGWWRNGQPLGKLEGLAAAVVADETLRWLRQDRRQGEPFLLMVNFYEPHWRVEAPNELVRDHQARGVVSQDEATYYACVEGIDEQVGRIDAMLEALELRENTLVIFTSDNGPATLGEDNAHNRNYGSSVPFRGRKYGLWEGSIRVPGLMRWPAWIEPGSTIDAPVGTIDWMRSIPKMAGAAIPEGLGETLDGADITPLLSGDDLNRDTPLQWHSYNTNHQGEKEANPNAALRDGRFVICGFHDDLPNLTGRWLPEHMERLRNTKLKRFALYDIEADPTQSNDLAKSFPEDFERLKTILQDAHDQYQEEAVGWDTANPAYPEKR